MIFEIFIFILVIFLFFVSALLIYSKDLLLIIVGIVFFLVVVLFLVLTFYSAECEHLGYNTGFINEDLNYVCLITVKKSFDKYSGSFKKESCYMPLSEDKTVQEWCGEEFVR